MHVSDFSSVELSDASGGVCVFIENTDGATYADAPGCYASLVRNGDFTWTVTFHKTGTKVNFTSDGQLTTIVDKNGQTLTYSFDSHGFFKSVSDSHGRSITVTANNAAGDILSVQDYSGRSFSYGYDGSGHLTSATQPTTGTP